MLTKIISILALASVIAFTNTAAAEPRPNASHRSWDRGIVQEHWKVARVSAPRHANRVPARRRVLEEQIERRVKNTVLPLRRLFNLGPDYEGYRVDAVIVKVRPYKHRGGIKLLVNGHAVDGQVIRDAGTVHLRLDDQRIIGQGLKGLKLDVRGKLFIKNIKIKMTRTHMRGRANPNYRPAAAETGLNQHAADRIAELILRQMYNQWKHR